jgi:hypothetical protein
MRSRLESFMKHRCSSNFIVVRGRVIDDVDVFRTKRFQKKRIVSVGGSDIGNRRADIVEKGPILASEEPLNVYEIRKYIVWIPLIR